VRLLEEAPRRRAPAPTQRMRRPQTPSGIGIKIQVVSNHRCRLLVLPRGAFSIPKNCHRARHTVGPQPSRRYRDTP
jgi:hypothetical protein